MFFDNIMVLQTPRDPFGKKPQPIRRGGLFKIYLTELLLITD